MKTTSRRRCRRPSSNAMRRHDCNRTILGSSSTATTFLALSSSFMVKLPVPGPISSTTSVVFMPALSTIDCTTKGFRKMCCPLLLWNSMPALLNNQVNQNRPAWHATNARKLARTRQTRRQAPSPRLFHHTPGSPQLGHPFRRCRIHTVRDWRRTFTSSLGGRRTQASVRTTKKGKKGNLKEGRGIRNRK
jgi:hypothetical protein